MNILDIMTKIPGLGGLVDKAPQALSGFLDKLLEENKPLLYIMFPQPEINEYIISIVTADKDDKILRSLKSIKLSDALSIIFNPQDNAD